MAKNNRDFKEKSTFDLAFGLASLKYNEAEKFEVLTIIRERQGNDSAIVEEKKQPKSAISRRPGSKSEMISQLLNDKKTAKQIYDLLNKKGTKLNGKQVKVYFPEIYRIMNEKI